MAILLLLLSFSVCQALPAEDVPETAYDESEGLPYEATPLFSIVVPQASARIGKASLSCDSQLHYKPLTKRCERRRENNARPSLVQDSLTILNHSLRC
jgi:hypothetical protein